VSDRGAPQSRPQLGRSAGPGWGLGHPKRLKRRGCVLSDAMHPQPAFRPAVLARSVAAHKKGVQDGFTASVQRRHEVPCRGLPSAISNGLILSPVCITVFKIAAVSD
jgi:hypothetical protein